MLAPSIRRGLAAGLLAGVLAGLFAFVIGEIPVREAIRIEESLGTAPADAPAASGPDDHADFPVSRTTQQALLPVATAIVGAAFGGLFGVAFALIRRSMRERDDWRASLKLGAVAWVVMALVPLLVAPPNPPGVGDAAAVGARSSWYLAAIVLSVGVAAALWALARRLRATGLRDAPRQVVVGGLGLVAFGALVLVLPAPAGAAGSGFPAELLWQFRLASFATQTLLWATIAVCSGLLWEREHARAAAQPERTA
ncbi:MAG: CbtA family protein [Nitriliruptor sp.]